MKSLLTLLSIATLLGTTTVALAQENAVPPTSAAPAGIAVGFPGFSGITEEQRKSLPESVAEKTNKNVRNDIEKIKVSLELSDSGANDALKRLMTTAKLDYDFDPLFNGFDGSLDLPERNLTLQFTNASLARVLDSVTRTLGIGWWAERSSGDERPTIHLVRLKSTVTRSDMLAKMGVNLPAIAAGAFDAARAGLEVAGAELAELGGKRELGTDKKVKLDGGAREVKAQLEDVLKQAGLTFSFDSDLPTASKNVAFENVPIALALDVICHTAEIGWKIDHVGEKIVVRVGKSYLKSPEKPKEESL